MKSSLLWKRFLIRCLLLALLTGCATAAPEILTPEPTDTPVPPTATPKPASCEEVEGICLWLSFDGESCTYEGPTALKAGPVTLIFINESEDGAGVDLVRHTGDETIQDMIDYIGEEPSTRPRAYWTRELRTYMKVYSGESLTWKGVLEPGVHTMICAKFENDFGAWFGTGLTVED